MTEHEVVMGSICVLLMPLRSFPNTVFRYRSRLQRRIGEFGLWYSVSRDMEAEDLSWTRVIRELFMNDLLIFLG